MRVMVIVKASTDSERGQLPSTKDLADMGRFNEELSNAGVMLAGEGLHQSAKGKRLRFTPSGPTVVNGPFEHPEQLVAGFWLLQVSSVDEAVTLMKKAPFGPGAELEIRQIAETDDFGAAMTPELRAQEERVRQRAEARH